MGDDVAPEEQGGPVGHGDQLGQGVPDVLGAPYVAHTLPLAPDDQGEVLATLVERRAEMRTGRAVLHVHGFADYFFQRHVADFWVARGYDFYALDLRRYGRSLRPHQRPNVVADLGDYYEELDAALARLRADHDHVVVTAHSTGGLVTPLWAHDRQPGLAGLVLNSPWLDFQGSALLRAVGLPMIGRVGASHPLREVRRSVSGIYGRSLHRDHDGEWDYDLRWKPLESFPVYAGWIRAIRAGHARVAAGLDLHAPVLVLSSTRTSVPASVADPDVFETDIVLDVEQIRRRASLLGRHVTLVRLEGAVHDVYLSRAPVREQALTETARFLSAYVDR